MKNLAMKVVFQCTLSTHNNSCHIDRLVFPVWYGSWSCFREHSNCGLPSRKFQGYCGFPSSLVFYKIPWNLKIWISLKAWMYETWNLTVNACQACQLKLDCILYNSTLYVLLRAIDMKLGLSFLRRSLSFNDLKHVAGPTLHKVQLLATVSLWLYKYMKLDCSL